MRIYWDITKACNLKCVYCYNRDYYNKKYERDMSLELIEHVLGQMKTNGVEYIHFMGGEPFLRNDFLKVLTRCDELGIGIGIATNGTLLNNEKAEHLRRLKNLQQITFSIDSSNESIADQLRGKRTWYNVINNMGYLVGLKSKYNLGFRIGIESVITKLNLYDIENTIPWALSLGVEAVNFDIYKQPMNAIDGQKNDLALLYSDIFEAGRRIALVAKNVRQLQVIIDWGFPLYKAYLNGIAGFELFANLGKRCPIISNSIWVGNDGLVQPCFYVNSFKTFSSDFIDDLHFGRTDFSLKAISFKDILYSTYFRDLYRFMHTLSARRPFRICAECPYQHICDACPLDIMYFGDRSVRECSEFVKWRELNA